MIVSAVSLWKKFNVSTPLQVEEWGVEERDEIIRSHLRYNGHMVGDESVRIYARFYRPAGTEKKPVVLLLPDAGKETDEELLAYFAEKGYAVLSPDYSGKMSSDGEAVRRTEYPDCLEYGNFERARGLYDMEDLEADKTTWFEWTYVALFSVEYLKSREDIGPIGVVGIKTGGEIAWQTMLSPDIKCGVPINAAGWQSFRQMAKFGEDIAHNLSDDRHRYIAAVEAQSYAPSVKCPVLMLCALRDADFDCDRAYDTYSRIGNRDGNALAYSPDTGECIGLNGLADMDLFLEKNLKGREIYIPETLNIKLQETDGELEILVECDKEGLLEETGIFYAEADISTKSSYRDWRCIYKAEGRTVKNGKTSCRIQPFAGATAVFAFAYAKYINGFRVMSKITGKRLTPRTAVKNRSIFSGKEQDCFTVANYDGYSIGGIFLEREALPSFQEGYGGIRGVYADGGLRSCKISSPQFLPNENALLEFNVYSKTTQNLLVVMETADIAREEEKYTCVVPVKGGGKWKRIILKSADFKGQNSGTPLVSFQRASAVVFDSPSQEEYLITNMLWL